eukprot:CAMPEP_0177651184 /NCGR_PEP_ID=MMETSP0447-20121125/12390_1 /TAXON_ID=0 /ORGANISM="Stygamoeba regulata, Strain BSH-02190019" /LENGTH=289 /DNA_ID=CAMNT_0019154203 /DNA_START=47 /DNA_END=913 /DNA_ORIENTATION=-
MKTTLVLLLCALAAAAAMPVPPRDNINNNTLSITDWDSFKVTWPKFKNLPQSQAAAEKAGWVRTDPSEDCKKATFLGLRYILGTDPSTMILFSASGELAGIQAGTKTPPPAPTNTTTSGYPSTMFVLDELHGDAIYTLTAYFREPQDICSGESFENAIGDKLVLQVGGVDNLWAIAADEADVAASGQAWVKGKCFKTMGVHYWFNIAPDMPCENILPVFVLYNRGKLNAFGWVFIQEDGYKQPGSRWEHPSGAPLKLFLPNDRRPACLFERGVALSTQHVYFTQPLIDW